MDEVTRIDDGGGTGSKCLSRRVLLAVLAALALLASACGGGDTTDTAASDQDQDSGSDSSEESADDSSSENGYSSPIADFLGIDDVFDDSEESRAAMAEQEREIQEKIRSCMQDEGFEYIPVDYSGIDVFEHEEATDGLERGTREFVEKWGFEISTTYFSQEEVGPDLVGHNYEEMYEAEDEGMFEDPNMEIVEAMDEPTQQAYYKALYGDQSQFEFDESMTEEEQEEAFDDFDFFEQGCQGQAYGESYGQYDEFYSEFSDEMDSLYESIEEDPRIVERSTEISDCVAEKGYSFSPTDDIWEDYYNQLNELDMQIGYPGEDLTEDDFATMSEEEMEAMFSAGRVLSDDVKASLAELQTEEVSIAVAAFDCGYSQYDQDDLYFEIMAEYEQKFLDDNADRLAAFKDSAG